MQDECGPNVSTGMSDLEAAERGIPISDGRANLAVPPTPGSLHWNSDACPRGRTGLREVMVMAMIGMTITAINRVSYGWCFDGLFSDSPKTGATVGNANAQALMLTLRDRYVSEIHMGRVVRILLVIRKRL